MKKILSLIILLTLCLTVSAQFAKAPAFPGAEGYGRYVQGGRGGQVVHVTNLNDSGDGSLRWALGKVGKRIIVFDVSGTIALKSRLTISNGWVTVLGQTAPGDGITIANYPLYIGASNVVLRYIRCRMGDVYNVEDDAMSGSNHDNSIKSNIIIDHCSMSWSTDECASFYGNKYFTLQWSYICESLKISVHDKGSHGYGGIWGGEKASFHHNLLAHHDSRNARLDHDYVSTLKGPIDYVNNCIYNWGGNNCYGGESVKGTGYRKVNFIRNYYKPGPATRSAKAQIANATSYCTNCYKSDGTNVEPAHFYLVGNYIEGATDVNNDNWKGIVTDSKNRVDVSTLKSDERFTSGEADYAFNTITVQSAATAWDKVLAYGGCSHHRDIIDERYANEARTGTYTYGGSMGSTGGLIDSQGDVGGWCNLATYDKLDDTDRDGMPDIWEQANGLDPNVDDSKLFTLDPKGYYTNVEVYANSLVEEQVRAQRSDSHETFEEYYPACKSIKTVTNEEVIASGNILWELNSNANITDLEDATPVITGFADYIDQAEASLGGNFSVHSDVFTDADGVTGIQFTAAATADGTAKSGAHFKVTPVTDYYFRPTSVEFYAVKNGSNSTTTLNAFIENTDGTMAVASGIELPRAYSSTDGRKSAYHCNATIEKPISSLSTSTLSLLFNGIGAGKQVGVSHIVINGDITKKTSDIVIDDPDGIIEVKGDAVLAKKVAYNLAGQRVNAATKGLIIVNGKKFFVK